MYKSYFKIGWRNLSRNKAMFAINIGGLALGIATCLIITLFVIDELSFDRFNEKVDQMVRVVLNGKVNGEIIKEAVTPAPVAAALKSEFPEVLDATRLRNMGTHKIIYQQKSYRDTKVAFVDPNFFEVFTLPFIKGDLKTALVQPNSIVITQEQANKYFGEEDPLNKILEFSDDQNQYKVTGVIEKIPANSHFHFDLFASMEGLPDAKIENWISSNYFNYLVLSKRASLKALDEKLPAIVEKYMGPQLKQIGMTYDQFKENGNAIALFVQPLTDIHLHSDFAAITELEAGGDIQMVYILAAVALFMLLIACINFMNLSTAGATKRSKEVGVKKVLGSYRSQLILQFFTESFISTVMAMVLALGIVTMALPLFNQLSGKELEIGFLLNPQIVGALVLLGIIISLLAGSYPAFFLSSFRPITALKNKTTNGGRSKGIRGVLVVFQFVISACLILAIIIVDQQRAYIQNKDVGYNKEKLIVLRESYLLGKNEEAFKNEVAKDPRVENVTMSAFLPAGPTDSNMVGVWAADQSHEDFRRTIIYNIDHNYIPTMGMQVVTGRNFSELAATERYNVIVNETAVKIFGLRGDPLGQVLTRATDNSGGNENLTIIGVVKDFHFRSLREPIAPLIMLDNHYGGLIIKAQSNEMAGLLASLEEKWNTFQIDEPFTYNFLDQLYNETYQSEQKMGSMLKIFGLLTIFIACLGLFGLVTFTAEQRVKEIGIRKVLGASVAQIVSLLSKDLIWLVAISFVIAFPLGYYLMNMWLQDFAYKIEIQWWVFVVTGISTLAIAFATMSFITIRSSLANPVESLRSE